MVIVILFAVTFAAAFSENLLQPGTGGQFMPMAYATGDGLVKEVGDLVQFKAKIKNTGNLGSGYIVVVLWSEHDSGTWETACIEDIWLETEQYELMELGSMECTEDMAGKYFDVKFKLYQHDTEELLDSAMFESVWYVSEPIIAGSIIDSWIY